MSKEKVDYSKERRYARVIENKEKLHWCKRCKAWQHVTNTNMCMGCGKVIE